MAMSTFSAVGRVVIKGDDLFGSILGLGLKACVVLKGKWDFVTKCEVGGFAAQLPNEVSSGTIDFVYGVDISSRD